MCVAVATTTRGKSFYQKIEEQCPTSPRQTATVTSKMAESGINPLNPSVVTARHKKNKQASQKDRSAKTKGNSKTNCKHIIREKSYKSLMALKTTA